MLYAARERRYATHLQSGKQGESNTACGQERHCGRTIRSTSLARYARSLRQPASRRTRTFSISSPPLITFPQWIAYHSRRFRVAGIQRHPDQYSYGVAGDVTYRRAQDFRVRLRTLMSFCQCAGSAFLSGRSTQDLTHVRNLPDDLRGNLFKIFSDCQT